MLAFAKEKLHLFKHNVVSKIYDLRFVTNIFYSWWEDYSIKLELTLWWTCHY